MVRGRGQAAVESVGVVVAIALLVAALAAWMSREVRPPAAPPPVLARVADPLGTAARRVEHAWSGGALPTWLDAAARDGADPPIGRFLRRVGGGARDALGLAVEFDRAWRRGIQPVVRRRVRAFLDDPFAAAASPDLAGTVVGLVHRAGRLPDYVRMLRSMPPREAVARLGEDLGAATGEVGFDVLEVLAKRRLATAGRGSGRPAPPARGSAQGP
jgi:hypothetical protein